ALAAYLKSLCGEIQTESPVRSLDELPPSKVVLCDITPRQLLRIGGDRLPSSYRNRLSRFRYGPGAFKIDWALDGPIPWAAGACESQIERFAPGFRDRVIARHVMSPATLERHNENLVGGDIGGGSNELSHLFTRPVARVVPYSTPVSGLYLCSSSTPPGGGVHGMCGYFAAKAALQRELR